MSWVISATSLYYRTPSKTQSTSRCSYLSWSSTAVAATPCSKLLPRKSLRCNGTTPPCGGPAPGGNEYESVLDAFFMGKALAEALNERIGFTVGEFLSTINRLQSEQQKQVRDFQYEVLGKAKRAKDKAARQAMEAQALIPKSSTAIISTLTDGVTSKADDVTSKRAPGATDAPAFSPSTPTSTVPTADKDQKPINGDPLLNI